MVSPAQQAMVQYGSVEWDVKEVESGHSPQLSMPGAIAEYVVGWSESWAGKGE
jgi:hypothetical protein